MKSRENTPAAGLAYCIGHYHAMGYAPFGFDDIGKPFTAMQGFLFGMDVNDPCLQTPQDFGEYAWFAKTLCDMMPMIAKNYGTNKLQAVCAEQKSEQGVMNFGKLRAAVMFHHPFLQIGNNGVALMVQESEDELYFLGNQCIITLLPGHEKNLDILELEEGKFLDGKWHRNRRLNGDEGLDLTVLEHQLLRIKIHTYNDEI